MTDGKTSANPFLRWWTTVRPVVNEWCGHAYRLAILLALLTICGAPLHKMATREADVTRVYLDGSFEVSGQDLGGLSVGDTVPVYRFNPGWRQDIGKATITRVEPGRVTATHNPREFLWPLGMQGVVTSIDEGHATVNLGSSQGVKAQERWNVFEDRKRVGAVRLQVLSEDKSRVYPTRRTWKVGQVVSRYTVANQITWMASPWIVYAEWGIILFVLGLWAWSVKSPVPGMAIRTAMSRIKTTATRFPVGVWLAWHAAIGTLVVFVVGKLGFWAITYVTNRSLGRLRQAGYDLPFHVSPFPEEGLVYSYGLLGAAYIGWLIAKKSSPVLAAWKALAFTPPKLKWLPVPRYLVFWALHLVVFFAFTGTLTEVLTANLRVVSGLGWRGAPLQFDTNSHVLSSVAYMLTHAPHPVTVGGGFAVARYIIWSTTISVCMVGYLHTVVSILWKKPVKNIDFTLTAWLLNGICYGPLLGGVLHHTLPVVQEIDPLLSAGPWVLLQQSSELFLNILYALSLWNLGTMFGVMVDKGVRTSGFYAVVRHPSYTLEGLMFFLLLLPAFTSPAHWILGIVFPIKYWIRSERDDAFMTGANPDYTPYRKNVPYKLLPGIY